MDWQEYVQIDPRYFRPLEVEHLRADAAKAREKLGWEPRVTFRELVRIMVDADRKPQDWTRLARGSGFCRRSFPTGTNGTEL